MTSSLFGMLVAFIFRLVLPAILNPASATTDYQCGSMEVAPCSLKHFGFERQGFHCETTDGRNCMDRLAWCSIGLHYTQNQRCNASENLMFDKCLSIEKTINGILYHINIAEVDWIVAEQYCQDKGMNLISFQDQFEYDVVYNFLQSFGENPKEIVADKYLVYEDKLAQRCWAMRAMNLYWTGIFYDRYENHWKFSDGTKVDKNLKFGQNALGNILERFRSTKHTGYLSMLDQHSGYVLDEIRDGHRRIDTMENRAKILCKKNKNTKWNGGIARKNSGCITGFKCAGPAPRCITGRVFDNSDVCNGKVDCPRGEDESERYCSTFIARFPDNRRRAHFIPVRRSVETVKMMCRKGNLTLPSLHSSADIEFLKHLPVMFTNSRQMPDFQLTSENWKDLEWKVLLGVRRESRYWEDGSRVGYANTELANLPSNSEVYLVFNATVSGKLVAMHEPPKEIFAVCQEDGPEIIPIPAVITVPVNSASSAVDLLLLTVAVLLLNVVRYV